MTQWAKLHLDIRGDPKLLRAQRRGLKHLGWLPWLIAFAKEADDDGRLTVAGAPAEPEDLVYGIPDDDCTVTVIAACIASCEAIGVLRRERDGALRFVKWEERQTKPSDSRAAIRERVQRHRKKKKAKTVTPVKRVTDVTVTPSKDLTVTPRNALPVTPCNATEKRERETNVSLSSPSNSRSGVRATGGASPGAPVAGDRVTPRPPDPEPLDPVLEAKKQAIRRGLAKSAPKANEAPAT